MARFPGALWEPATSKRDEQTRYLDRMRLIREVQGRDLTSRDYELLLSLSLGGRHGSENPSMLHDHLAKSLAPFSPDIVPIDAVRT